MTLDGIIETLLAIRGREGRGDLRVTIWNDVGRSPCEYAARPVEVRDDAPAGVAGIPTPERRVVIGRC